MYSSFLDIPEVVIDYVRQAFGSANDSVSQTLSTHPSMHEPALDQKLVSDLNATPPAFFASERIGVSIESHWLGGRGMFHRWEIADIAFFVMLRKAGHLVSRKVALVQTKRLYPKELPVSEMSRSEYFFGIGRLADQTDRLFPLSTQRSFSFDEDCEYRATDPEREQAVRIRDYIADTDIPVYYGLYNPLTVPFQGLYPAVYGGAVAKQNLAGIRVLPSENFDLALARQDAGRFPSYKHINLGPTLDSGSAEFPGGWRLETFMADEVLRCRQGKLFESNFNSSLQNLLYGRSAPITAGIYITIDLPPGE